MKLVDSNVLLYAVDEASPHHQSARRWLVDALSGARTLAFAWVVLLAFVRLSTHARVFERPVSVAQALDRSTLGSPTRAPWWCIPPGGTPPCCASCSIRWAWRETS